MKIAILLLVHKNREQIKRLISRLRHSNIDIFVHLDKKATFLPEELDEPNIIFTEERFDVGLFEFSMIQAEKELIKTAKSHGSYSYYILLSGQCYPIKRIEYIYNFLCDNYPKPFIEIISPTEENGFIKVFSHVYLLKRFKRNSYSFLKKIMPQCMFSVARYIPALFVRLVSGAKEIVRKSPEARLRKMKLQTYFGPQWWILPDCAIIHMGGRMNDGKYCQIMMDCFSCDESFFHTAIMEHAETLGISLDERGRWGKVMTFQIFDGGHPVILSEKHYSPIVSSHALFARKFDINYDSHILDLLDTDIHSKAQ